MSYSHLPSKPRQLTHEEKIEVHTTNGPDGLKTMIEEQGFVEFHKWMVGCRDEYVKKNTALEMRYNDTTKELEKSIEDLEKTESELKVLKEKVARWEANPETFLQYVAEKNNVILKPQIENGLLFANRDAPSNWMILQRAILPPLRKSKINSPKKTSPRTRVTETKVMTTI